MEKVSQSCDYRVRSLPDDKDEIERELMNDTAVRDCYNNTEHGINTTDILKREQELGKELHELSGLKSVPGLVLEIETNLALLEFENCYHSLRTLRRKLHANSPVINRSFGLQQSIARFVDTLHLRLVTEIYTLFKAFWELKDDSIIFHKRISRGKDELKIEYSVFVDSIEKLFFTEGHLNSKTWFISNIVLADLQESVRTTLASISDEFIHLSGTVDRLKALVVAENDQLRLADDGHLLSIIFTQSSMKRSVNETLETFECVLQFIEQSLIPRDKIILVRQLCPMLVNELSRLIKENAFTILQSQDISLKEKTFRVNEILAKLFSDFGSSLSSKTSEIQHLLSSEEMCLNLKFEKVFLEQLQTMRMMFKDDFKRLQNIEFRPTEQQKATEKSVIRPDDSNTSNSKIDENDDWAWEEDDGWDSHMELNIEEDNTSRISKQINAPQLNDKVERPEHAEDGWDENWDVDFDTEDDGKSLKSTETRHIVRITSLPKKFIVLIKQFTQQSKEICSSLPYEQYHHHKLNLIQTAFVGMCMRYFQQDWWQLLNDLSYLYETDKSLTRLHELGMNNLEFNMKIREKAAHLFMSQQLKEFEKNESRPSWDPTIIKFLPYLDKEIMLPLASLDNGTAQTCIKNFVKFLYDDCIIKQILNWSIISERNAENLSELVTLISAKTESEILNSNREYQEIREKFAIIGKFLPLHLKDIMEMFYHGDFYLFTTDEVIQWIVLLFAETPLRRNAIDDIREIRNVQLGED